MTVGRVALDLWMAAVVVSVISVGFVVVAWAWVSLLTVADARHRARRRSRQLGQLPDLDRVTELAEIDEALERILAGDHAALHGRLPG
jgi:Flp pilus assembly protein TadB